MKVADVKLGWTPSVSAGVVKQVVKVSIDGAEPTVIDPVSPEVGEIMVEVKASSSVVFSVLTTDSDGTVESEKYTFLISDLELPQPATNLFHEVVAVREVPDPTV